MGIAHETLKQVSHAIQNVHAGADKLVSRKLANLPAPSMIVSSPSFAPLGPLPRSCSVEGAGVPPVIAVTNLPPKAKSLVLVCEDPDAPFPEPYVHWIVYAIPPSVPRVDERTIARFKQGKNSKLKTGFTPAAPPPGHGVHHYHFQVFALDTEMTLDAGMGRGSVVERMREHVIAWGEVVGTYERR